MKIVRINKLEGGATAAFVDIETNDGIIIKGFRLVNGAKGMFLAAPEEKGKDGKYYETVILPKELKTQFEKLALEEYKKLYN